jgi:hypothetical protein
MRNTNFNLLARATPYEVARAMCNREEAMQPYKPVEIPKMQYPSNAKDWSPASVYALVKSILP